VRVLFCRKKMKQYKLLIAYDGTDYSGWIQQKTRPSIVQTLQDSFASVFGKRIQILGASKTDAGVHALGQVAIFKTDIELDSHKVRWAWNNVLPSSILIRSLEADDQFHPHYRVKQKIYYYHLFVDRPLPFVTRYGQYVSRPFDPQQFQNALDIFAGTHDFSAFYTGNDREDAVRTIDAVRFEYIPRYNVYRVVVIGERFLRHMVRRMVGAALAVASREGITHADIRDALQTGGMHSKLPTAPARGLLLRKIIYEETK